MRKKMLLSILALSTIISVFAQKQSFDALRRDYPLLMQKFGDELSEQRADYIFAIDVSGTMAKYRETVVPALDEFFNSLQNGDYVSIIKFGGEASNDVGSAGEIGPSTVSSLIECAGHIYDKPSTKYEREKYYNWTDLDNMLHYVAKDMQQVGRNHLKFVFIITDFVHDPAPDRRGHEDWQGVANKFATEQADNDVHVFALQLPGGGRDLEKVRNVFPRQFGFNPVPITSGQALSDWFTQRKNAILLDKFIALVSRKNVPTDLSFAPEMDIDGNLTLSVSWSPNSVYDNIRLDKVTVSSVASSSVGAKLPLTISNPNEILELGTVSKDGASLLKPSFRKISGDVSIEGMYDVPYLHELRKLGIEPLQVQSSAPVTKTVFFYPLPLWLFCTIVALIILYIILVIRAFARNSSSFYKINGKFEVKENGAAITERKVAIGMDAVEIGQAAAFLPVEDCNWTVSIKVKRYNPFILFFKRPEYVVSQTRGNGFKTNGVKWGAHQKPKISRYSKVYVASQVINWIA